MNISGIEIDGNGDADSENNYILNTIPETNEATKSPKA
jgi:hypothetical protein